MAKKDLSETGIKKIGCPVTPGVHWYMDTEDRNKSFECTDCKATYRFSKWNVKPFATLWVDDEKGCGCSLHPIKKHQR